MTQPTTKRLATEDYVQRSVLASIPGATVTARGAVRLAGDLAGTADAPTVPGLSGIALRVSRISTKKTISANYTLVLADATDSVLHVTAATAVTITLPTTANVAISQEITIPWRQFGAGIITFAAAAGVTLVSRGSVFRSAGQYAEGTITKVATDTWILSGDIAA
jgi:hypothetical protein